MFSNWKKSLSLRKNLKNNFYEKKIALRQEGKDPQKGWHSMVNTGMSGSCMRGAAVVDITGRNLETYNYFSEAQKQLAEKLDKKNY